MNTHINPELVQQITSLVQAYTAADRRLRDMFHGWEQLGTRAGLERGFYVQIAQLPGSWQIVGEELDSLEEQGRIVYEAYLAGGLAANISDMRA